MIGRATSTPLRVRYAIRSDLGLVRAGNEDSGYAAAHLIAIDTLRTAVDDPEHDAAGALRDLAADAEPPDPGVVVGAAAVGG